MLRRAGSVFPCVCNGRWIPGALRVLDLNCEAVDGFCYDVRKALEMGAKRGANFALIGQPGCGKSMMFEPFDDIYTVMGKPEDRSSFPLAGVLDAQVLLWQDWRHNDATVLFEDILSLIVGERMSIRCPFKKNISHRNSAPLFYTSNTQLRVVRQSPAEAMRLNQAMEERFRTRFWGEPLPMEERVTEFPRCGRCCANFYLQQF